MNTNTNNNDARPRVSDKRTAILQAALSVFAEGGVNGVAMPVVAQVAGVGTGTVYRYFANKDALVNELFREQKGLLRQLYADLDTTLTPRQQFSVVWQRMIDFGREHPASFRFIEMQDHRPYLDAASVALERELLTSSLSHYRAMQKKGVYRHDVRPQILMALVWGAYTNLIKAERDGYIELGQEDIDSACAAAWSLCTG